MSEVTMDNTKDEILEALEEAGIEADESLTKAELLELLEDDSEPVEEEAPPPAIVPETMVTTRSATKGITRKTLSEHNAET